MLWIGSASSFAQTGRLDPTFRPAFNAGVLSAVVLPDGKILAAGRFTIVNGEPHDHIVRLNPDGTTDSTFNGSANDLISRMAVAPDGRIVIAGNFTEVNGVFRDGMARLRSDGSLDETFEPDQWWTVSSSFVFQQGGGILFGGPRVYRLHPDGTWDSSFHVLVEDSRTGAAFVTYVCVLPNEKILFAGNFTTVNGAPRRTVARLNSDGTLDNSFDNSSVYLGCRNDCLLPSPDGGVIVGGNAFARLLNDGSRDPEFVYSGGGLCIRYERAFASQKDGKFLAGGSFNSRDGIYFRTNIARYLPSGMTDPTFDPGFGVTGGSVSVATLAMQSDQRVLVGGYFTDYDGTGQKYLARVLNDWPVLDSRKVGPNDMELRWPAVYTNFFLQTASSVPSTNWITVTNSPVIISNMFVVTNSTANGNEFFRLVKP
jgi:uncharacterized delta-60 repeat protein